MRRLQSIRLNCLRMILFIVVTCWMGIAAGAPVATTAASVGEDDDDEIESLTVSEGGNLSISIHFDKWEEDPQVLVFRLKLDSSREPIAQIICHKGACDQRCWRSGVSLIVSESENVTLILINVIYNQTGLYEIRKHSNKRLENKIYNVTVYQPPLSTIIPEKSASAMYREFTPGISAATVAVLVVFALVVIIGAVIYRRRRKENFGVTDPKVIMQVPYSYCIIATSSSAGLS